MVKNFGDTRRMISKTKEWGKWLSTRILILTETAVKR